MVAGVVGGISCCASAIVAVPNANPSRRAAARRVRADAICLGCRLTLSFIFRSPISFALSVRLDSCQRATDGVWLWLAVMRPAFTLVLTFIVLVLPALAAARFDCPHLDMRGAGRKLSAAM